MSTPKSVPACQIPLSLKYSIFDKTASWETVPVGRLMGRLAQIDPAALASGFKGIWLRAWYELPELGKGYLPWLDVEHPDEHHKSITANLDTARELAERMARLELLDGLVVGLSGSGVRFALPWACEPALAAGFEGFLRDKGRFPGIDASPQLKGQHFRWTAYRGNRRQVQVPAKGAPPTTRDIHVHFLDRAEELLRLTEARYRELTAGRPDPARMLEDVRRCLPTTWTPEPWRELLTEYDRDARLRRHIVRVRLPKLRDEERRARTPEPEVILAELASRGIRARELMVKGTPAWRRAACPVCGKGEGHPTLYASGWLHDFRATCPAGGERDLGKGLPWRAWSRLAGLEHLAPDQADADQVEPERQAPPPGETMTVEAARAAIRTALAGEDDVIVRAAAGTGKSFAGLAYALAEAEKGGLVLFSSPETGLAMELEAKAVEMAQKLGLAAPIMRFEGRNKQNCGRVDDCNDLAARGFSPSMLVCPACADRESCAYRAQFDRLKAMKAGVVFCAHAATPAVVAKVGKRLVAWMIDETCLDVFMRNTCVNKDTMSGLQVRLVNKAEAVLQKLATTADKLHRHLADSQVAGQGRLYGGDMLPPGEWSETALLWDAAGISPEERTTLAGDLAFFDQHAEEKASTWQKRLLKERVDLAALAWWKIALGEARGRAYVRVSNKDKPHVSYRALTIATPPATCRLVNLDATADPAEMRALFGRDFRVVDARVTPPAGSRFVHVQVAMGKYKTAGAEDKLLEKYLGQAISYLRPGDKKVLLATHMAAQDRLLAMAKRLAPDRTWAAMHHWAGRGVNAWEDFDAQIVLGTPTPNRSALLDREMALFDGDMAARDAWFTGLSYRDLVQTTARTRPVLRPRTVVVVGRHWPAQSLGAPSFVVDARRKGGAAEAEEEAYRVLVALAEKFGVIFHDLAASAGIFLDTDRAGLADWEERWRPAYQGETPLGFVLTQIKNTLNTVRTNSDPLSPILINRRSWSALLARVAADTGLPALEYKPRAGHGAGRPQAALGHLTAVRRLCSRLGVEYDPSLWDGQARPSGPPDWLSFPPGSHFVVDGVAVDAGTVYRIEDPTAPRQAVAAAAPG